MRKDDPNTDADRRRFVKLAAGTAVVLPLGGLVACSGEDAPQATTKTDQAMDSAADAAAKAADDAQAAAGEMAAKAEDAMSDVADQAGDAMGDMKEASGGLPRIEESDPVAKALGYRHDASKIDANKYAGRGVAANEYCKNCVLYIAGNDGWGACSIFAGKAVNADGWCASYNRKSG